MIMTCATAQKVRSSNVCIRSLMQTHGTEAGVRAGMVSSAALGYAHQRVAVHYISVKVRIA